MTGSIESIRAGKGMLPKNLPWIVGAVLAIAGIFVMYIHNSNQEKRATHDEAVAKTEKEEALRRDKPRVEELVVEATAQASPPTLQQPDKKEEKVPAVEVKPQKQIEAQAKAAAAEGDIERYKDGVTASAPILVLTGDEGGTTQQKQSAEERVLNQIMQTRGAAQPAGLSPEDKKVLQAAAGQGAAPGGLQPVAAAAGEEYLQQGRRNESWYQQAAADAATAKRRTIGLDAPVSPYTIIQGTPIPAVTVTPINSDLPGEIIARTTQDIYDSVRQQYLLIPAGSLCYGIYNSSVIVGQSRLAVVFNRIVFPDGSGVTLGAMPGIDAAGSAGVPGDVDNHFWQMFGSSMLIAGVAALVEPRSNVTNNIFVSGGSQGIGAAGQVLVDVTRQIQGRNTRIAPTVKVPAGERFNILVKQDLALAPYGGRK